MRRRPAALALLLIALASGAGAQEPALRVPQITVSGRASVQVVPDLVTVTIGVTSRAATAAAALDETSAAAAKIAASARTSGIEGRDIRTSQVSLQQQFRSVRDAGGGSQQLPDGFAASNSVELRVRDVSKLGEILRRGIGEGANRLGGVAFGLSDRRRAERDALAAAVADAQEQARTVADAAGVKLGAIQEIRVGSRGSGPVQPMRMELRAAPPPVPIEAGEIDVAAEVEVTWRVEAP